jgi:small subunit ribosomal protein S16
MCAAGRICPAVVVPERRHCARSPRELEDSDWQGNSPQRALRVERNRFAVVMIRLARVGARKQPYYRVVVIEKDRARNGRSIEVVGTYNPRTNPATVELKHERIAYWRGKGAQLSPTMAKLVAKFPAQAAAEAAAPAAAEPAAPVPDPAAA